MAKWPDFMHHGNLMKRVLIFFLLTCLLTGCGRSDATIQQRMAGTWLVHFAGRVQCTNYIRPNGDYVAIVTGLPNGGSIRIEGTIMAKDGELIETITRDSDRSQLVPFVVRGHVVRLDEQHMVTRWDGAQSTTTEAQRLR